MPLDTSSQFHDRLVFGASINGVLLNSRAELSSDGRKLVLFVTDKIPGNARVDVSLNTAGIKDLLGRELDGDGDGQRPDAPVHRNLDRRDIADQAEVHRHSAPDEMRHHSQHHALFGLAHPTGGPAFTGCCH